MVRCGNKVEQCGSSIAPLKSISTPSGEGFELHYKITLDDSLKAHKMLSVVERAIEMSGAFDGNTLTKSYNCVTAGIKMFDVGLIYPMTGKVINTSNINVDNNVLTQSRDRFFPLKITIRQESKATMENIRDLCQFLTDSSTENDNGNARFFLT